MSTTTSCRREEVALCQPDKTILIKKPNMPPTDVETAPMSETEFLRRHTLYSATSSWLFAIAGATNIGVLCALSSKILTAAEQGKPISEVLSNKKYNRIGLAMIAFGGACMAVSNYLESMKVSLEWKLGANRLNRKIAGAERQSTQQPANQIDTADAPPQSKNWVDSVQSQVSDTIDHSAVRR